MKSYFVFFDRRTILDFLRIHGNGPDSKDYELLIAIILSKFLENMWGEKNVIGFELKDKYSKNLPDLEFLTIDYVKKILREYTKTDTFIDVIITKGTIQNHEPRGVAFQLKRFGKNAKRKNTRSFIEYLDQLTKKYSKVEASLVIIVEPGVKLDTIKVRDFLRSIDSFPFNRLMFMANMNNRLSIGELWPKLGMDEYDSQELMNEFNI